MACLLDLRIFLRRWATRITPGTRKCSELLKPVFGGSVLLAPVRMLFHTVFVVSAFLGWEVVWNSPQRDDDSTSWGEAFKRHGSQLLLGLVWAVGMAWLDLRFLF